MQPATPRRLAVRIATALLLAAATATAATVHVGRWAYQLQDVVIDSVAALDAGLVVIDPSADGTGAGDWPPADIARLRAAGKLAVAYLSIGEAEDYRWYWDPAWSADPPAWLGPENPDWPGNYKVRFWDPDWQAIVFQGLHRIAAQGFDGVYLDIVDAYWYWSEEVPENPQADADMVRFVAAIGDTLRSLVPGGLVIPQNGEGIVVEDDVAGILDDAWYTAVDAVGVEDVFCPGDADEDNPWNPDTWRLDVLAGYRARDKAVLSVEYLARQDLVDRYLQAAALHDFVPYVTVRPLDRPTPPPVTAASPAGAAGLRAGRPFPNPSAGPWFLPVRVDGGDGFAELEVVDLRGRRLLRRRWSLSPGERLLGWSLPPAARRGSGVLLYRLRWRGRPVAGGRCLLVR